MIESRLSSKERQEGIYFAENLDEIKKILNGQGDKNEMDLAR